MPDPRVEIPMADRIARRTAVVEALGILTAVQELQRRLEAVDDGLALVEDRLADRQDNEARGILALADSVRADAHGVSEAVEEVDEQSFSLYFLGSTRDAPTEADRINLMRMGEQVGRVVSRLNAFLTGRVGAFRQRVESVGIGVFPDLRPVQRPGG
jgi:hypothetical protein